MDNQEVLLLLVLIPIVQIPSTLALFCSFVYIYFTPLGVRRYIRTPITGVSSGFGYEMTKQLLEKGDVVIGTVRNTAKVEDLIQKYPVNFDCRILDVTDVAAVQQTVKESFEGWVKLMLL